MANQQTDTARSGKTETLTEVLERIQRMRVKRAILNNACPLIIEDWDWLVVLQCLQDHNLFKSNPKRPPLLSFELWMREHNIPQYATKCTMRSMSRANNHIAGARYPWTDVTWEPHILQRWRKLYRTLSKMLYEMDVHTAS